MAFVYESNNGISVCTRACRLARAEGEAARPPVRPLRGRDARERRSGGQDDPSILESRGSGDGGGSPALIRDHPIIPRQ
jgi:hypothetical protein